MVKHTPGPWNYIDSTQGEIHDSDGDLVLQIKPQNRGQDEAEANCRLVAAAPDLLRECEFLLKELEARDPRGVYVGAMNAIEKARGKE